MLKGKKQREPQKHLRNQTISASAVCFKHRKPTKLVGLNKEPEDRNLSQSLKIGPG